MLTSFKTKYLAAAFFVGAALTLVAHALSVSAANSSVVGIGYDIGVDALVRGRGTIATLSTPSFIADAIVAFACSVHCNVLTFRFFVTQMLSNPLNFKKF